MDIVAHLLAIINSKSQCPAHRKHTKCDHWRQTTSKFIACHKIHAVLQFEYLTKLSLLWSGGRNYRFLFILSYGKHGRTHLSAWLYCGQIVFVWMQSIDCERLSAFQTTSVHTHLTAHTVQPNAEPMRWKMDAVCNK